jgi:hypothetical protein
MAFVGSLSGSGGDSNTINVTGSMIVANPGTGGTFPAFPGSDTVFFVSGAIGGKSLGSRTVSVFGGDVVASGSITVGTGSVTITSNEVQFFGGVTKVYSGSGGLTFTDSTGTKTLSELAVGGPSYWTSSTPGVVATTGSVSIGNNLTVTGNQITGSAGGNITLGSAGAVTVAGDLTAGGNLTVTGNNINSSTGATAITLSGANVIIPGDLTVQGTTVTMDVTTVTIEDPLIGLGFTSGSVATAAGDRGFIGGIQSADNVAFVWQNAQSVFTAARTTSAAGASPITVTSYSPVRGSKFELGGTAAYVSSSDGANLLVNHTSTTTFTKAGTPVVQVSDYNGSGEGQIKGVTTSNALAPLWLSGSVINVGAPTVSFLNSDIQQATIKPQAAGAGVRFEAQDGTGTPRLMLISGSQTTIGANTGLVAFERAGVTFMSASANAGLNTLNITPAAGITTSNIVNTVSTTVSFAGAATTLNMGNAAGTNNISGVSKFPQGLSGSLTQLTDGTSYIRQGAGINVTSASNGAITIAAVGTSAAGADTQIQFNDGGTAFGASANFTFNKATNSFTVVGDISGSNEKLSGNLAVNGGNITTTASTFNMVNVTPTTVNFAGGATTLLNMGATAGATWISGSVDMPGNATIRGTTSLNGAVYLGDATSDDLTFNGYAASSIIPKTTNAYDLGTATLRWRNMYTGDLHLKNERGDWTVIEEEDYLTITNNKSGKRYKFVLEEI